MSLYQAIEHKKEHRKQYKGAKLVDESCRNHGGCPYCEGNRLHQQRKEEERTKNFKKEVEEWVE